MNKINWFKRIFMSWASFESYFSGPNNSKDTYELVRLKERIDGLQKQLDERAKYIESLNSQLKDKNNANNKLENEINRLSSDKNASISSNNSLKEEVNLLKQARREIEIKLSESQKEKEGLNQNINAKLETLGRIEKTFFGSTGNKGKGEFGELQLENILVKSGLPKEFWLKNLMVNSDSVEFAIKSGKDSKWIPVDSKVLEPEYETETNEPIINKKYIDGIKSQAKKVSKYLSKKNTTDYGLLVLQNDIIYTKLFEADPHFFQDMIRENKITIASPSTFIQFAWSVAHIIEIYEKVHGEEKMYKNILDMMTSTFKLANSVKKSYDSLKIAVETHYPTVKNRQIKVLNSFGKNEKLKELPNLSKMNIKLDN